MLTLSPPGGAQAGSGQEARAGNFQLYKPSALGLLEVVAHEKLSFRVTS